MPTWLTVNRAAKVASTITMYQVIIYRECVFNTCRETFAEGFTFLVQNVNNIVSKTSLNTGDGIGYNGFGQSIAV